MSVIKPDPEDNGRERKVIERTRKILKNSLKDQIVLFNRKGIKRLTEEARFTLAQSYYDQAHSEFADAEMIELCTRLINLLYPEGKTPYQPDEPDDPEDQGQDGQESWQQEYHHPQRPPHTPSAPLPRMPAPCSPFVDRLVCLHCEKYFWGQIIIRTATCPLCGKCNLLQVSTLDLRTDSWFPF